MILLDTDHLTVLLDDRDARHIQLKGLIETANDDFISTTVISVEEQCRGWLAIINRQLDVRLQVPAYRRLAKLFNFLASWDIILFDAAAADEFLRLRKQRIRIGTQDMKVASIALMNDALLLSANLRDFQRIPHDRVENWLV
jgi:tRNA(fMet)-specific endonuclease VapC